MMTDKIVKLTRQAVADLLASRGHLDLVSSDPPVTERRRNPRVVWPFPGTVAIKPLGATDDQLCFATCRDISLTGVGMTSEEPFDVGSQIEIAIHLPEATFYGQGTIRYCAEIEPDLDIPVEDRFALGVEFNFNE